MSGQTDALTKAAEGTRARLAEIKEQIGGVAKGFNDAVEAAIEHAESVGGRLESHATGLRSASFRARPRAIVGK